MKTKNKIRIVLLVLVWASVWFLGACNSDKYLTERTVAQTQARIAEADSAAQVSRNQAETERFATLAKAAKPDNTVLLVLLVGFIALVILVVYKLFEINMVIRNQAQPVWPYLLSSPQGKEYWLLPDGTIEVRRLSDNRIIYVRPDDVLYDKLLMG